jgi:hypothetical protein
MNIFNLISDLEKVDGDVHERLKFYSRRTMFSRLGKMAAATAPVALASVFNKAYAFTPGAIDVLKYALTLEYLEDEFYKMGNSKAATLYPNGGQYTPVFMQIGKHETAHVLFLEKALGYTPMNATMTTGNGKAELGVGKGFDFTAGGAFADVFTNFGTFVAVSHAFEDTGVRAYKGQATNLMAKEDEVLLDYALQIHSVEARHASVVRYILNDLAKPTPPIKPWITLNQALIPAVAPIVAGEENLTQGGVNLKGLAGKSDEAISEAFDEPLTKMEVLAIATPFIVK